MAIQNKQSLVEDYDKALNKAFESSQTIAAIKSLEEMLAKTNVAQAKKREIEQPLTNQVPPVNKQPLGSSFLSLFRNRANSTPKLSRDVPPAPQPK